MAVQWIDTPNEPLPTRSDAIDFVVSSEPSCISVSFGAARTEERAYRDGIFLYPYLASTRNGDTFALRRAGGWPRDPTVYVDEAPASPVSPKNGNTWGTIYEKDFTGLPHENIVPGAVQIDDLTWYLKGSLNAFWSATAGTGGGIRISTDYSPLTVINSLTEPNSTVRWFFPFAQLPLYNPLAPTVVQWRGTNSGALYRRLAGGLLDGTNDALGPLRGPSLDHYTLVSAVDGADALAYRGGRDRASSGIEEPMNAIGPVQAFADSQFMVMAASPSVSIVGKAPWSGAFLPPEQVDVPSPEPSTHRKPGAVAPINLGFQMFVRDQFGGDTYHYRLTHLRVSQPRPA